MPPALGVPAPVGEAELEELLLPQAASSEPTAVADSPMMLARTST